MRRLLLSLLLLFAAPAAAQWQSPPTPLPAWRFNPAADYVTAGQDEPGYRAWYGAASWRPAYVRSFHEYLVANGVGGIVPTWQLLRTASEWRRCGADPFEVPPSADWSNIVATLRFISAYIVPALGPVEPVSVYRNPALNVCAGGAETSTHREMGAVDIVPLRPISREALMVKLCAIHAAHPESSNGLGFYKGLRFHIDARKYREWGTTGAHGGYGCAAVLAEGAAPFNPGTPATAGAPLFVPLPTLTTSAQQPIAPTPPPSTPVAAAPADRLAPLAH